MQEQTDRRWLLAAVLGLAVLLTGATGCSRPPTGHAAGPVQVLESGTRATNTAESAPLSAAPEPACSRSAALAELAGYDDGLAILERSVELVIERDRLCGLPEDFDRQCRAVFLLGSTQPAVEWADGGAWQASLRVWQFAASDGAASASSDFVLLWAQLGEFVDRLAPILEADDEAELALRLVAIGDAADDLAALEDMCLASAG